MLREQLLLQLEKTRDIDFQAPYRDKLVALLSGNLDFHDYDSSYASHNYHSFPAKFPPQLPRKFIHALTAPGDTVLDPMSGSGTTVLEAYFSDRRSIGFDIDPLALLLCYVKANAISPESVQKKLVIALRETQHSRARKIARNS